MSIEWHDIQVEPDIEWLDFAINRDFYEVLEVSPRASAEVIKKAYRVLVEKYHPDRNPAERQSWAEEMTKQLNEAFSVLSDGSKRSAYDHQRTRNHV